MGAIKSVRGQNWIVVLSAALFFFYEFIQMNMFNAINPSLMQAFSVSATRLGNLSAMYFYGNVLFLFVAGILLDRFSTRRLLLTAITVCVLCTYLFAMSQQLWQAEVCRLVTGLASTFCMLSCVRLASRWFDPRQIALVIGVVLTFAMTGGMLAQTPMTLMTQWLGWRHAVMCNATLGVVFIFLIFKLVRDYPAHAAELHIMEKLHLKEMGFWDSLRLAVINRQNWLAGIYTNFLSFPIVILGAAWGSMYLMHVRGLTHTQSTYVTTMIFLGTIIGSPLIGFISDKIALRKAPMIIGAILSLVLVLLIMFLPNLSLTDLMVLFFLLAVIASSQVIAYPLVVESNPRAITTTAEGLACTIIMSAGLFQVVFGWLVDLHWNGQMANGVPVYTSQNFQTAMWMFPIVFVISLVISFLIKETHAKHE